ncbi:MAG: hypothetical protein GY899_11335 [Verrucomicrobiaceae bacterium]|nr:hypothetical protein [Verrucomicrobiaceae bacterium]
MVQCIASSAPPESSRKSTTLNKLNLVGTYAAKVGGKYKRLTLSARGKCNFLGTSGEWKVRNGKGKEVVAPSGVVSNGEVDVYLQGIRMRCYFRVNDDGTLAAYAVTGFGGGQRTLYKKPVVYRKS